MDSLIKFSTEVIKTAQKHKEEEVAKLKAEEEARLLSAKTDIQNKKLSRIRIECTKQKLEADKKISVFKNDLKKGIYKRREEMFGNIFAEAQNRIKEYKNSSEYHVDMINNLKEAADKIGGGDLVCVALSEDITVFKEQLPDFNYEVEKGDIIGGFSLMSKEKGLYINMTLKGRLEEEKKKFYKKSGLVIG